MLQIWFGFSYDDAKRLQNIRLLLTAGRETHEIPYFNLVGCMQPLLQPFCHLRSLWPGEYLTHAHSHTSLTLADYIVFCNAASLLSLIAWIFRSSWLNSSVLSFTRDLVSLDLWRNKGLTPDGVICLADGCILLQELDIGWWWVLFFFRLL